MATEPPSIGQLVYSGNQAYVVVRHSPGPYGQTVITVIPHRYAGALWSTNQGNVHNADGIHEWAD